MKILTVAFFVFVLAGCATHPTSGLETSYQHASLQWQASASLECDALSYEPLDDNIFLQEVSGCKKKQTFLFIENLWYPASEIERL